MSVTYYPEPSSRKDFHVAIICATQTETNAVEVMFDDVWDPPTPYGKANGDKNSYHHGRIGSHNVVLAYLPGLGTVSAASSASTLGTSFRNLRLGLVVGICGGVPKIKGRSGADTEVLLGDVIISTKVVQYKYGAQHPERFEMKETLDKPSPEIRAFLNLIEGNYSYRKLSSITSDIMKETHLRYPGVDRDRLYRPLHRHKHHLQEDGCGTCQNCNSLEDGICDAAGHETCESLGCSEVVHRDRLVEVEEISNRMLTQTAEESAQARDPKLLVHFGAVASGNLVMKSGFHRDEVASSQRVIAFEMESAGVWENLQTIVIKGVSDYADSHKRDEWQEYAATRAAACMKATLKLWQPIDNIEDHVFAIPTAPRSKLFIPAEASAQTFDLY